MRVVAVIQARLTSTRFPKKVLAKVNGKSMISRVCEAARDSLMVDKVVVAWAHKFPWIEENNVLDRFRAIAIREKADIVVRLTSDCPLLTAQHIDSAIGYFLLTAEDYYSNHLDGYDVQVFYSSYLWSPNTHPEHVIADFTTEPRGLSVNTPADLERVRKLC